jgi:Carboxypeptidase regulatory-like domain/TonB-dependent Receptor Plug Domain
LCGEAPQLFSILTAISSGGFMSNSKRWKFVIIHAALSIGAFLVLLGTLYAQSTGTSGSINGTVTDPTGAVVPDAKVEIHNPVSHFDQSTTTDAMGTFSIPNVPFNPYHMTVTATGFAKQAQDVDVRSVVPVNVRATLQISSSKTTVTVEAGGDLVENDPTFHTDIDQNQIAEVPLESQSSALSAVVTNTTPGIAADSNGQIHGLGDHAENSISLDGQQMTDQTSKVFSNQVPADALQSMEVISGAPPAEYGDKPVS